MHPKHLCIRDFTYDLPEEKIAKYPLADRHSSKLLVYQQEKIIDTIYKELDQYLPSDSLLILNNTKVIEARIIFQKPTGGTIEIFCLESLIQYNDVFEAMSQKGSVVWLCLIGGASKWKPGEILQKKINAPCGEIIVEARFLEKTDANFAIKISWTPEELSFTEMIQFAGNLPLPPYLKRKPESIDKERYQTVYANHPGSVAAPTAGLHFTKTIFEKLELKKIHCESVTLHVGAGTFKPVKSNTLEQHEMHKEFFEVGISTIENLLIHSKGLITAVGTTSLRTLESLYWMGVKVILNKNISSQQLMINQWDPYELPAKEISTSQALEELLKWMVARKLTRLLTKTQILIAPGYTMKFTNALITNFHQPRSTLLLLVAAFVGKDWRKIYDYALENHFRFLSYGDGCLLLRN